MRRMTKDGYYLNRHSCFLLQYHMVLVTKYRNPVLTGPVKEHIYSTIQKAMEEKEIRILEMNGEPDLFSASQFSNNCKLKIQKRQMLFPKSAK